MVSAFGSGVPDTLVRLTKHTRHRHTPSPVSPNFEAPPAEKILSFKPIALAAAIARTATTREDAPARLLDMLQRGALGELEALLEGGAVFSLNSDFQFLADTAGSQFAAKVGAGIAHLYMDALGYVWRANAICLSSTLDPHADFIYGGGNVADHGVVLAEAHGSFAKTVTASKVMSAAKRKYKRQVKPYVATHSTLGRVVHGYSIAFGSNPTVAGSFLAVSETQIAKPKKNPGTPQIMPAGRPPEKTPTSMALATYRSNFALLGAWEVVRWIDWLRLPVGPIPERQRVEFLRLRYAGRTYLTPMPMRPEYLWWIDDKFDPQWWKLARRFSQFTWSQAETYIGWFAIEESAGSQFLDALSDSISSGERVDPSFSDLPTFEPVGFKFLEGDREVTGEGYHYALFRDGFALLSDPYRGRPLGTIEWIPDEGVG